MRRTNTVVLAPSVKQHQHLLQQAEDCARLWNEITYRRRQSFFEGRINWEWGDLYDKFKGAVEDLWLRGVAKIVIGDLTGILGNTKGGRKSNAMRHNFWSHRYLVQRVKEVAEEYGIAVELVDERGTSSRCPRCSAQRITRRGRLFKCLNCGLEAHRDSVGAVNIGVVFGGRINGVVAHPVEVCA